MKAFKIKRGTESYYRVELPQRLCPDGKRHSVMGKTKTDAMAKAEQEVARWERGLDRNAGEKTLAAFLSEFLAYYKQDGGIAPSTYQDYRYHIESHIVPLLGKVTLRELDPRAVDAFTRALTEKGLAARTSQYSYSVLRRALQFAVDWKYIPAKSGLLTDACRQATPDKGIVPDTISAARRGPHLPASCARRPTRGTLRPRDHDRHASG